MEVPAASLPSVRYSIGLLSTQTDHTAHSPFAASLRSVGRLFLWAEVEHERTLAVVSLEKTLPYPIRRD